MTTKSLLLVPCIIFALYSCKSNKIGSSTETNDTTYQTSEEGEFSETNTTGETVEMVNGSSGGVSNTYQTAETSNENASQVTSGVNVLAQTGGSTGGASNVNMGTGRDITDWQQVYTALEMSEDQIRRLEKGLSDFQKTRVSKPNGEMMGSIDDERKRQMKDILTEEQFKEYLKWHADNN